LSHVVTAELSDNAGGWLLCQNLCGECYMNNFLLHLNDRCSGRQMHISL